MRTTLAIATALAISLPALPAGAASRVPQQGAAAGASNALSRPGAVIVLRPGVLAGQVAAAADGPVHGSLSLEARHFQGAEALTVEGNGPANTPVTITLLATVSPEIPTIVVSRHDVVTDVTGRFGAVIPIASAYERGTLLTIVATSASGASASAHLVTDAPNAGASVPLVNH